MMEIKHQMMVVQTASSIISTNAQQMNPMYELLNEEIKYFKQEKNEMMETITPMMAEVTFEPLSKAGNEKELNSLYEMRCVKMEFLIQKKTMKNEMMGII